MLARIESGTDVVMDIDVQGAARIRACDDPRIQLALVDLFVMPPSEDEPHARPAGRGTDDDEIIALRLRNALEEMARWPEYSYRLISGDREEDYARFIALLTTERLRVSRISRSATRNPQSSIE